VLAIHEAQISEHGGDRRLRDLGLLESTLARPRNAASYYQPPRDIPRLAALYAVSIIKNHPFMDGNKRTGLVACELFLSLNGYLLTADDQGCYTAIFGLAARELTDRAFINWVAQNASSRRRAHGVKPG
jgi:death-on-curing protein